MPSLVNIQGGISQHLQISRRPGAKSEVKAGWNTRGKGGYAKKSFRERTDMGKTFRLKWNRPSLHNRHTPFVLYFGRHHL